MLRVSGWRISDEVRNAVEPVIYAEALAAPLIAEQFGIALQEPPLDWLPNLRFEYRKRWVRLCTLGEARRLEQPAFVKPPNDKSFPAQVYIGSELPDDYPDHAPVLMAEIVQWEKEFRCFILDRSLHTFSIYLREGELQEDSGFECADDEEAELRAFLAPLLANTQVELLHACVLDVGVIAGRGWAVVEQNAAWGSGLYGCDPDRVLPVIQAASAGRL